MNTILTRLSAELIEKYEAEGFWQGDTIYALVRWHAEHTPQAFAVRDRFRRLTYRAVAGGGRCARRRSRPPRCARRPARRRLAAEPDRERGRAAGLLEERRDLLPVAAPRPHRRRGGRADAADALRRLHLAERLRRRCRQARPDRRAEGGADAAACLSAGAAHRDRQGAVRRACRRPRATARRTRPIPTRSSIWRSPPAPPASRRA